MIACTIHRLSHSGTNCCTRSGSSPSQAGFCAVASPSSLDTRSSAAENACAGVHAGVHYGPIWATSDRGKYFTAENFLPVLRMMASPVQAAG